MRLMTQVHELRTRMLAQGAEMIGILSEAVAERVGRQADDFEVRTFAGALIGVALAIAESPGHDYLQQFGPRLGAPRGRTAYLIAEDVASAVPGLGVRQRPPDLMPSVSWPIPRRRPRRTPGSPSHGRSRP